MLVPSCSSASHDRCAISCSSAHESAAAFGISRSMMNFGIVVSCLGREPQSVNLGHHRLVGALSHDTRGFQSANIPLGLSFHAHACSAQTPNVELTAKS